jgi:uncharacterized membrane protein YqjE
MAREQFDAGLPSRDSGARAHTTAGAEPSLGELFRQLTTETGELIRQEVNLAKAEMRQTGATVARDSAKIGIAAGLALAGLLALTAFLVVGLGEAFNNYWLSALIVAVAFLGVGGVLARNAVADIKRRGVTPRKTAATLRDDAAWAKEEAREFKRELTR